MGRQESMIVVDDLAEAYGIISAIKEFEETEWFYAFGAERALEDLHYGDPWGMNENIPLDRCRVIPKGTLIVAVGGGRNPYQYCDDMAFLDGIVETNSENYFDYFERIPDHELKRAARMLPRRALRAYRQMVLYLKNVWDDKPTKKVRNCRARFGDDLDEEELVDDELDFLFDEDADLGDLLDAETFFRKTGHHVTLSLPEWLSEYCESEAKRRGTTRKDLIGAVLAEWANRKEEMAFWQGV